MARARSRKVASIGAVPGNLGHKPVNQFLENASDIIILNDRAGRIVAANRAAREFGGYTQADVERGVYLPDVLPPADCEAAMILTQRALDGLPVPEVYEREAIVRDGSRHALELRSNVLTFPDQPPLLQTIGRDVTEKKEAAAFQTSLLQLSQGLLTAQSLQEVGRVICDAASYVLHVDGAYLWLRQGDDLVGSAAAGRAAREFVGTRRSLTGSLVGQIYRGADVFVANDFVHSPFYTAIGKNFGVQAMLAVPLRSGEPPVGVLVFTDTVNPRRFTSTLRERVLIFAAQTTVAIESTMAREREEEEGRVSASLLHVARAVRESLEEAEILPQIARAAREALPCDWTVVALWDAARSAFRITTTEGLPKEVADELNLLELRADTMQLVERVFTSETVEITEPQGRVELYTRWGVSSLLAVPMVRAGRVIGALVIGHRERRGPFSSRERRIAEGIAAQAAVAVENARLVEDLRRANALKSEFLGTMSHELRTPLSAILGYADLMREGAMGTVNTEQAQVLDRIRQNGSGLLELISMTLDVNRLESGRVAVQPSEFTLEALFDELRSEFGTRLAQSGVTLAWRHARDVPPLYSDQPKLKAVVRNLIDNALKFTPEGSVEVRCGVEGGDRVWVAVRDTGVGIDSGALASIFDMFQQIDSSASLARGGVGLGLYVVRRYTELLGGKITVESALGAGSKFTVEIPRRLRDGGVAPPAAPAARI